MISIVTTNHHSRRGLSAVPSAMGMVFAISSLLTACPICPRNDVLVIEGMVPLTPGQSALFGMRYGDDLYTGARACELHWYVNEIEGGNREFGTISSCGRYTAPSVIPEMEVFVDGTVYELYACADCCPGSRRLVTFVGESL